MISVIPKVVGARAVYQALGLFENKMGDAMSAAIFAEGFAIMAVSVPRVPVQFGRLKGSNYVAPPTEGRGGPTVELGYGVDYAVPVHELHKTKSKFLQNPMNEAQAGYEKRLGDRAWGYYKRGVGARAIPRTAPPRPKGK